jgi:hypothetical protein
VLFETIFGVGRGVPAEFWRTASNPSLPGLTRQSIFFDE